MPSVDPVLQQWLALESSFGAATTNEDTGVTCSIAYCNALAWDPTPIS